LEKLFGDLKNFEVAPVNGPIEFRLRYTPLLRWIDKTPIRQIVDILDRPRVGRATTRHMVTGRR
jgi:hypothetical protein